MSWIFVLQEKMVNGEKPLTGEILIFNIVNAIQTIIVANTQLSSLEKILCI